MQEIIEPKQAPLQEHQNNKEAAVYKIKCIKVLKISLNF